MNSWRRRATTRPANVHSLGPCESWSPAAPASSDPMSSRRSSTRVMRCGCLTRCCRASTPAASRLLRRSRLRVRARRRPRRADSRRRAARRRRGLPSGGDGRARRRLQRRAAVRRLQRPGDRGPARGDGPRAGPGRLVLASSMVVYGEGAYSCAGHGLAATPPPRQAADLDAGRFEPRCERCGEPLSPELVPEEAPLGPRNVYAATKLAQEHIAGSWARATAGHAVALRYHNVYGPGMPRDTPYAGVASFFRSSLEAGRAPRVFEDGAQLRDFVHVRDVAGATVAAIEAARRPGRPRRAGHAARLQRGQRHPAHRGPARFGAGRRLRRPDPVVTGEYRLGDVRHITASSERIWRELGWRAARAVRRGGRGVRLGARRAGRLRRAAASSVADAAGMLFQISYAKRRAGLDSGNRLTDSEGKGEKASRYEAAVSCGRSPGGGRWPCWVVACSRPTPVYLGRGQSSAWWGEVGAGPVYQLGASGLRPGRHRGQAPPRYRGPRSACSIRPVPGNQQRNLRLPALPRPRPDAPQFRMNYGVPQPPRPIGGWESPTPWSAATPTATCCPALAISLRQYRHERDRLVRPA